MTIEELCALRDKLIMDDSLTTKEQTYLFGHFQEAILNARNNSILTH